MDTPVESPVGVPKKARHHGADTAAAAGLAGAPKLSPTEFASAVTAITSAFGDPTRRSIYLLAHESATGVTAGQIAAELDVHANVARHHLDKLAAGGHLQVSVERPAGKGAGRPAKHYRVTEPEMPLQVAVGHNDILVTLLGRALSELGAERSEALAEEVGLEFGRTMAGPLAGAVDPEAAETSVESQRSFRAALHAVADALTAHGFSAHAEEHQKELRIVAEHCPFGGVAVEHPVICAVDRGLVRGMLGRIYGDSPTETSLSIARGDQSCATTVEA